MVEVLGELAELYRIVGCIAVSPRQAERAGQPAEAADGDIHGAVGVVDGREWLRREMAAQHRRGVVEQLFDARLPQHVGRHAALDDPAELRQAPVDQADGDRDLVAQRPAVRKVAQHDELDQVARQLFRAGGESVRERAYGIDQGLRRGEDRLERCQRVRRRCNHCLELADGLSDGRELRDEAFLAELTGVNRELCEQLIEQPGIGGRVAQWPQGRCELTEEIGN